MLNEKPLRVVMVDDDTDDIFLTKMALQKASIDFEFVGLQSGAALFDYINTYGINSIDLILLDINIPVMNGHDILAKLKTYPDISRVSIMMFTTSRHQIDQDVARQQGATAFAVKPSSIDESKEIIGMMLTLRPQMEYASPAIG